MITCSSCGSVYDDYATYCNYCDADLKISDSQSDPCGNAIERSNLTQFSDYYLIGLKESLNGFRRFFGFLSFIFSILWIISVLLTLTIGASLPPSISTAEAIIIIMQFGQLVVYATLIIWFASLVKHLVRLQTQKIENDIHNTIVFREESTKMAKEILKEAEKKAENRITMTGDNAILAFDGGTVSGITQTKTIEGGSELLQSLALLISYCELEGDQKTVDLAKELSVEATKTKPDKHTIFELWNQITGSIPQVSKIVGIAQGIKKLLLE